MGQVYFYDYMIDNYIKEASPAGDLARDMKNDPAFPTKSISRKEVKEYLKYKNACSDCMRTFDECWEEYRFWHEW